MESDYGPKIEVKKRGTLRRLIAFVGPAYLVSVGYMDSGNWATDIEGLDDLVFGQTVSAVRHALSIPVLVVRSHGQERAQRSGQTG